MIIGGLSCDSLRITNGVQEEFTNPIALRMDVSDDPQISDLLQHTRFTLTNAAANRDYPFENLLDSIDNQCDYSRAPIFQTMLIGEHSSLSTTPVSSQALASIEDVIVRCDLVFFVREDQGALQIQCEYDTALFNAATIRCLLDHYQTVLENLEESLSRRVSEIQLLSETERHQTIVTWNLTSASYPQDDCLYTLFEKQVKLTPDREAVVCGDDHLTYGALEQNVSQFASLLQAQGVTPDTLVGLFVERSLAMVIALLAILKAGGAYVPLDPTLPARRLELLLEDTQVSFIVAQPHLQPLLPQHTAQLIPIEPTTLKEVDAKQNDAGVKQDNLACVLHTSGSTGQPKGVMLSHRMLLNLIYWHKTTLRTGARTLQFAALGFDQSIHEMFAAWASGGTLYILPEPLRSDVSGLADYLIERSVEKIWLPVVMLQHLAELYCTKAQFPCDLKEVLATGEQLRITQPLRELFAHLEHCSLANHYGPTESHLATVYQLASDTRTWPVLPPIGRPIANTHVYLVDRYLQPVPIGLPGELCISGHCLARGYWKKPELTAEAFVPNPFTTDAAARTSSMYRTGDLARFLPNGDIEFLGRLDHQIKIRGMRVEPGEIEVILTEHPGIQEAVVVLSTDMPDEPRLVAYVVPTANATLAATELRQFLEKLLPMYMVPSTFIILDQLPLNKNGKIDRQALPSPDTNDLPREDVFAGPRTPLEEKLVAIWSGLLRVNQVGIYDNFFALGGHSLLGAQLISLIRRELQVELTHIEIFENPTIAGIAETIEHIRLAAHLEDLSSDALGDAREEIEL